MLLYFKKNMILKKVHIILIVTCLPTVVEMRFPYDKVIQLLSNYFYGPSGPPPFVSPSPVFAKNTGEIIRYYGYPFENHTVTTKDGYILELHRIPHAYNLNESSKSTPIILVPGLFTDSGSLVMMGNEISPGFVYSNAGYDIWFHNNRGTTYSRKHINLNPDVDKQYWNYSFHEMGVHDLPTTVDYILNVTMSHQVYLIGQSMGTTVIAVFLAENPTYSTKIRATYLLSQAIQMANTKWTMANKHQNLLRLILALFDNMDIMPFNETLVQVGGNIAKDYEKTFGIATKILLGNLDSAELDEVPLQLDFSKFTCGSSVKVLEHFIQIIAKKKFTKYDYDRVGNLAIYGQETPPEYNLGVTTVPVSIISVQDDFVTVPEDADNLAGHFKNIKTLTTIVTKEHFGHEGYVVSPYAKTYICNVILEEMTMLDNNEAHTAPPLTKYISYSLIALQFSMALCFLVFFLQSKPTNLRIRYSELLQTIKQESSNE